MFQVPFPVFRFLRNGLVVSTSSTSSYRSQIVTGGVVALGWPLDIEAGRIWSRCRHRDRAAS